MKTEIQITAIIAIALALALIATTLIPTPPFLNPRPLNPVHGDIELFYTVKIVISTVNVILLVFLLFSYLDIYRKIKSEFTIALMLFSTVLLLYALTSNPIIHLVFGFRAFGLGPFAVIPDLFSCIAVIILLYLNLKY